MSEYLYQIQALEKQNANYREQIKALVKEKYRAEYIRKQQVARIQKMESAIRSRMDAAGDQNVSIDFWVKWNSA